MMGHEEQELHRKGMALAARIEHLAATNEGFGRWLQIGIEQVERGEVIFHEIRTNLPTIVCLCGSTRFGETFHEANLRETLAGKIVLSIGVDCKSDTDLILAGDITEEDKIRLDELHLRKIDLCDEILVLNVGNYIGKSTKREIAYAMNHGKRIRWLEYDGLSIYHTSERQWIEAFLAERITEMTLAQLLDIDVVDARLKVERYLLEQKERSAQ